VDRPFGFDFTKPASVFEVIQSTEAIKELNQRLVWIDHHKSSIDSHPNEIPGYRIDGVAACRLAWQWFSLSGASLPQKPDFVQRSVVEPFSVRLAGEYDIWDKRDDRAETFQYALRACDPDWGVLLGEGCDDIVSKMLSHGQHIQEYAKRENASII
jgi:oligoribonuclease NrnB/cAMP/cGMP phosphodiesterase (DHH superfamily)